MPRIGVGAHPSNEHGPKEAVIWILSKDDVQRHWHGKGPLEWPQRTLHPAQRTRALIHVNCRVCFRQITSKLKGYQKGTQTTRKSQLGTRDGAEAKEEAPRMHSETPFSGIAARIVSCPIDPHQWSVFMSSHLEPQISGFASFPNSCEKQIKHNAGVANPRAAFNIFPASVIESIVKSSHTAAVENVCIQSLCGRPESNYCGANVVSSHFLLAHYHGRGIPPPPNDRRFGEETKDFVSLFGVYPFAYCF
ncbi:hypothetical protein CDAR_294581 [Caerostris darwini]|uniref:Uncharacterized protein n=1 Tax=Caerostris darwini TaxID=1538125 RepID=A0AAV4UKA4_9ARAC|nr:hypothetical protein CDAR_294581 [Caerostris darwini]